MHVSSASQSPHSTLKRAPLSLEPRSRPRPRRLGCMSLRKAPFEAVEVLQGPHRALGAKPGVDATRVAWEPSTRLDQETVFVCMSFSSKLNTLTSLLIQQLRTRQKPRGRHVRPLPSLTNDSCSLASRLLLCVTIASQCSTCCSAHSLTCTWYPTNALSLAQAVLRKCGCHTAAATAAASSKQQAASSKQQAASSKQQAASSKQQAASSKQHNAHRTVLSTEQVWHFSRSMFKSSRNGVSSCNRGNKQHSHRHSRIRRSS